MARPLPPNAQNPPCVAFIPANSTPGTPFCGDNGACTSSQPGDVCIYGTVQGFNCLTCMPPSAAFVGVTPPPPVSTCLAGADIVRLPNKDRLFSPLLAVAVAYAALHLGLLVAVPLVRRARTPKHIHPPPFLSALAEDATAFTAAVLSAVALALLAGPGLATRPEVYTFAGGTCAFKVSKPGLAVSVVAAFLLVLAVVRGLSSRRRHAPQLSLTLRNPRSELLTSRVVAAASLADWIDAWATENLGPDAGAPAGAPPPPYDPQPNRDSGGGVSIPLGEASRFDCDVQVLEGGGGAGGIARAALVAVHIAGLARPSLSSSSSPDAAGTDPDARIVAADALLVVDRGCGGGGGAVRAFLAAQTLAQLLTLGYAFDAVAKMRWARVRVDVRRKV